MLVVQIDHTVVVMLVLPLPERTLTWFAAEPCAAHNRLCRQGDDRQRAEREPHIYVSSELLITGILSDSVMLGESEGMFGREKLLCCCCWRSSGGSTGKQKGGNETTGGSPQKCYRLRRHRRVIASNNHV